MSRTVLIRHACFIVFAFFVCTRPVPVRAADAGTQAAHEHHPASPSLTPQQALDRLMEGNRRFVEGRLQHPHQTPQWRAGLTTGQHPIAAILGCSDSRVPVEELFDQGFGDVFVIRVAGNVAAEDERGSIEYAVAHLDVPLVLVVGHEQCGAVTAALSPESDRRREAAEVQALLARIDPALKALASGTPAERVQHGVEANARMAVEQLIQTPLLKERIARNQLQVKAAVYELGTGRIRLLE